MSPVVSIIVPAYNAENYIGRCIDSILAQTFTDFELFIIDDGSTDSSPQICEEYAKRDSRIKVIHKANGGVSSARNEGLDKAAGEYVMFCDSDDYVSSDWCYELVNAVLPLDFKLGICGFDWYDKDENKHKVKILSANKEKEKINRSRIFDLREAGIINALWNKIFSSEIIGKYKIRFDTDLSLGEDSVFILEYLKVMSGDIIVVNKPLYSYEYKSGENLAARYYENLFDIYATILTKLRETAEESGVDWKVHGVDYYNSYFKAILKVMDNTFNKKNTKSFLRKIRYNSKILKSKDFKESLKYADIKEYNKYHLFFLKTGSYFLYYIFLKVHN